MIDMRTVRDDIEDAAQAGPLALDELTTRIVAAVTAGARARLAELTQAGKNGDRSPQAEA